MELTDKEYFDISPFLTNVRRDKIIYALALEERCAKDGILTYDRECNELRYLVKSLLNDNFDIEAPEDCIDVCKHLQEFMEKKK